MDKNSQDYWEKILKAEGMAPINTELPSSGKGTMYYPDLSEFTDDVSMLRKSASNDTTASGANAKKNWVSLTYTGTQGQDRNTALLRLILCALDRNESQELLDMLLWRYYNQNHRQFTEDTGRSRKYLEKWRSTVEDMILDYCDKGEYGSEENSMTKALISWYSAVS